MFEFRLDCIQIDGILFEKFSKFDFNIPDTTGYTWPSEFGRKIADLRRRVKNIAKFFNQVRDFELVAKEDRVISFIKHLNLLIDSGDDPPTVEADLDQDAVNILTIHKAKGLEFRVVFLVNLVQGKFPLPKRAQQIGLPDCLIKEVLPTGDFHIQEERRLFSLVVQINLKLFEDADA